jgi:hypothetical protein
MTEPHLRIVGKAPAPDDAAPFFLIVADHDQGFFSVEGPMTNDQAWQNAARHARDQFGRRIVCGPAGPDRNALAAEFQRVEKLAGVPPGSIVRPRTSAQSV